MQNFKRREKCFKCSVPKSGNIYLAINKYVQPSQLFCLLQTSLTPCSKTPKTCSSPEAELKLPQMQRDLPAGPQKEGAQGLLPLPVPYHSSGPPVIPGQATQQADPANDSKTFT